MKKILSTIIAAVFVLLSATTAQAATNLESMLKEVNVPAAEAKAITDYVVANNISNETVDALVSEAKEVLALIGDSALTDLGKETQALIRTKVVNAAASVGLTAKIDGAKVALYKANGEVLVSLSTDIVEEIVNSTKARIEAQANFLSDLGKRYKEERTLYNNNRPKDTTTGTVNGTSATTPTTLNKTGFNAMPLVAGLAIMTLGAGLFVASRKINA